MIRSATTQGVYSSPKSVVPTGHDINEGPREVRGRTYDGGDIVYRLQGMPDCYIMPPRVARAVVKEVSKFSCGPTCGDIFFATRGLTIKQETIEEASYVPIDVFYLAQVLNKLEPSATRRWFGRMLQLPSGHHYQLLLTLNKSGSWAAVMWERGAGQNRSSGFVDGVNDEGRILIRDPCIIIESHRRCSLHLGVR